ncbi:MAG: hypothetical protein LBL83_06795, partial [Clostridiales bacterium]|nr:hypothetical protein [Clostridiales bacterium]
RCGEAGEQAGGDSGTDKAAGGAGASAGGGEFAGVPRLTASVSTPRLAVGGAPAGGPDGAGSASNAGGAITVTISNLSASAPAPVRIGMADGSPAARGGKVAGRWLVGAIDAKNTFERPDAVRIEPIPDSAIRVAAGGVELTLPPCCVAELRLG